MRMHFEAFDLPIDSLADCVAFSPTSIADANPFPIFLLTLSAASVTLSVKDLDTAGEACNILARVAEWPKDCALRNIKRNILTEYTVQDEDLIISGRRYIL